MINKEKIFKGLKCCQDSSKAYCNKCPYIYENLFSINYCTAALASDAFDLLKENPDIVGSAEIEKGQAYCKRCGQKVIWDE